MMKRRKDMENIENKRTPEELADEAVDAVAGGTLSFGPTQVLTQEEIDALLAGQKEEGQKKR